MEIQNFIELFRHKLDELLETDIIIPSKRDEEYNPGDWTFLMNCIFFDIIKEYNLKNKADLAICAEPEIGKTPNGRGGYSDILICSHERDQELIAIEHENFPYKRLSRTVQKLSKFNAKAKLIITYYFNGYAKRDILTELKEYVTKFFPKNEVLHLLIADCETDCGKDYLYYSIGTAK